MEQKHCMLIQVKSVQGRLCISFIAVEYLMKDKTVKTHDEAINLYEAISNCSPTDKNLTQFCNVNL